MSRIYKINEITIESKIEKLRNIYQEKYNLTHGLDLRKQQILCKQPHRDIEKELDRTTGELNTIDKRINSIKLFHNIA